MSASPSPGHPVRAGEPNEKLVRAIQRRLKTVGTGPATPPRRGGQVFVLSAGGGLGHVGVVEPMTGGVLTTIEGNTNDGGSREGIGVFRRTGANGRKLASVDRGFIETA